ncbi:hypothetical protein [Desulfogranum marinum]|uniref:TRAFAC clade GTPase domain-containing protein n=1 Tax=Desulfogranum marinum TaxID=453220 RepID=UPI001964C44F|nr:hypothetical protein [Desulfogranum marinum]MBM9514278.1 hypothetical protein [Desulfogranum marinum]
MSQNKIILCGLPASGKTTFIAALWYILSNKEISTTLSLGSLPKSRNYLNELSRKWSRLIQVARTPTDEYQEISISLKSETSTVTLSIPDMSGETWRSLWSNRSCPEHVAEWTQNSSGILLFLHSDKITPPVDIVSSNAMVRAMGGEPEDREFVPWSPDSSPTQVILVDLLQSLTLPPLGKGKKRLGIIISAWDKTKDTGSTPGEYLRRNLPLLHQFLQSSDCFTEIKIYGVSAQGGDFESEKELQHLKDEDIPSKRILVVDGTDSNHDLTLPIQWLMKK